ncbi:DUF4998 domain-containing protein [Butyricimonas synergistica]|uniref:DUF4998 domain-containing protein n=1 Tax=Butyricimonas synergistica TaxID=544644 RepID=UPI000377AA90|nr:DUF4998 domain-containing protein [Butyricimonas synergistica]
MRKLLIIVWLWLALASCEGLEETYDDYAGDGKIRYIGMCKSISVEPGWERLIVSWENSIDPVIENIEVAWIVNGVRKDSLLSKDATTCDIRGLEDGNYEVLVSSVDKNGNKSIAINDYGRPYTLSHEIAQTVSRVVIKNFFIKNRLVLFFDKWSANIESAEMKYTLSDGSQGTLLLTRELVDQKYYLLPVEIDPTKPVTVHRKGYIANSEDLILFDPYELGHGYNLTSDFKFLLKSKYGQYEITSDFVENQNELEIDYSINSIEDLLYFPNLTKLYLGRNRYMLSKYVIYPTGTDGYYCGSDSKILGVEDISARYAKSLFILNTMHELNGLTVERYNQHFLMFLYTNNLSFVENKGNPEVPEREFLSNTEFTYQCSVEDAANYDSHLENLFDQDVETAWMPEQLPSPRRYVITVDFETARKINGVQFVQRIVDPRTDRNSLKFFPGTVLIQGSNNGVTWFDVAYAENQTLGKTIGETTEVSFRENLENIRYLKFTLDDSPLGSNYSISLAELGIF